MAARQLVRRGPFREPFPIRKFRAGGLDGVLALLLALGGCAGSEDRAGQETVVIAGRTFHLELAADPASREQGLMYRESIPEDGGMLFVFPAARPQSFWMGNCLVDMDIIFLDSQARVTAMHDMKAEPPRGDSESEAAYRARMPGYSSVYPAQFAIELQDGWLERLGLQVEDKIPLDVDRLKRVAR